ncbi:type II toxin-antitoxin system prevent-host-death family antitoxin [Rhizobium sp. PL01]|jgi:prevent-host-death family protein|uniref:type II toxin-antitoxin system Phd/YefM family antitoxin n=1 Tax=Rhizobium sp. PL01 TaxID=3085631 RepID=UPI0029824D7A|nr:type II toxin-antitoxin system prevent-host-death family antitoxin [Rhizobium sp. PL01]MDW5318132.1 type II toxin-antitoxin system prevent-host-death family antitoxin [Rhizobium sp. PL01]
MTRTVKVAEAKTHLSELLTKVELGEEIIISRGDTPVARLVPIDDEERRANLFRLIRRDRAKSKPVSLEEILQWRDEGRK